MNEEQQIEFSIEVRDKRNSDWYWIHRIVYEKYAPKIGVIGLALYNAYASYARDKGEAWPSLKIISEKLKISIPTIIKYNKLLEKYKLIKIKSGKKSGKPNIIYLLKVRGIKQVNTRYKTGLYPGIKQVNTNDKNNNDKKEYIIQAKQDFAEGALIKHLIAKFKSVNPSYEQIFKNKTQRACLSRLLKKLGQARLEQILDALPVINKTPYAPTITTPYQLETKLGDLIAFFQKEKAKKPTIFKIDETN